MSERSKTNQELIEEVSVLPPGIRRMEQSESEQKRAEEALPESEDRYRTILQTAMDGFWMTDAQGHLLEVNETYCRMSGYSRQELLAMRISDLETRETADDQPAHIHKIMAQGEGRFESWHRRKDGTIFSVEASVQYRPIDGGRFVGFLRDITERRRAEQALLESESRFKELYDVAPVGYQEYDMKGRITRVNQTALDMLGYSREEMIGQYIWKIDREEDAAREQILAKLAGKLPPGKQLECTYCKKDGTTVPVLVEDRLITDEQGKIRGIRCSIQDITERKRMEEETAALAEIARVISSTLDIDEVYRRFDAEVSKLIKYDRLHVNLVRPSDQFVVAYSSGIDNPSWRLGDVYTRRGTTTGDAINMRSGLLIQPETASEIEDLYPSLSETFNMGLRSAMIVPLIAMDEVIGSIGFRSRKLHAFTDKDLRLMERIGSRIAGAIANAKLFSDLKKTENSLREGETRFRRIVETADEGIRETNSSNQTTFVNRKLSEMLGYSPEELLSRPFSDFMFEEDHSDHIARIKRRMAGFSEHHERKFRRKDGTTCWALVSATPVKNETGQVTGSFAMFTDITQRKRAEEELERHKKHLEDMVRDRTEELEIKNITLQELNATLKVLLKQREDDKKDMEERFVMNVRNLVLPFVEQMKKGRLDAGQQSLLDIIATQIHNIATPLLKSIRQFNLTPKELKVAVLVKEGKSTKEIADILGLATGSVDVHRKNIRKKLRLSGRGENLQSYFQTLDQ